jgi:hypothetical protein
MECRLSVGWFWSVFAGNAYELSDKIDLVEEKRQGQRTSALEKKGMGQMAISDNFSRKKDEHE